MIITTPNARVLVHNYNNRSGYKSLGNFANKTDKEPHDISHAVISIDTNKNKSQPSGQFSVVLAPTANWVASLSPGSWLTIHIKNSLISDDNLYDKKSLKMVGRIDSVRSVIQVDQTTGARQTVFYIVGRDWGQIFESIIYIDVLATWSKDDSLSQAIKMGFDDKLVDAAKKNRMPSTSELINFFIELWGTGNKSTRQMRESVKKEGGQLAPDKILPHSEFVLPESLGEMFGENIAQNILPMFGKLEKYDTYKDVVESVGMINMRSIIGGAPLWNILQTHSNQVVNEIFCDLRWDDNKGKTEPWFAMYKRIRPFYLNQDLKDVGDSKVKLVTNAHTDKIKSSFFYVARTDINKECVASIDYGTNWLDRINFVEIIADTSIMGDEINKIDGGTITKFSEGSSYYDPKSFAREGLKPMLFSTVFLPTTDSSSWDLMGTRGWVPVVSSWYFDAHKMLNGTMVLIGHDDFIGVGDNISIDNSLIKVPTVGSAKEDSKILAHVESVSHKFAVGADGNKSFYTTVTFVRGVVTDATCTNLTDSQKESFGIDSDSSKIPPNKEEYSNVIEVKHDTNS